MPLPGVPPGGAAPAGSPSTCCLLDGLIYWWHRANHEWPLLWRFHVVHHLDRFLDATSAIRFHFGEVLISATARAGAIVLLGFPLASILAFETLVLIATVFHHSNLRLPPQSRGGTGAGGDHALDPLGASPAPAVGYGFQLRHGVQLLGPAVREPESDAARSSHADRRRGLRGARPSPASSPDLPRRSGAAKGTQRR